MTFNISKIIDSIFHSGLIAGLLVCIIALIYPEKCLGQTSLYVIGSGSLSADIKNSFLTGVSLGEPLIESFSTKNTVLTQGFLQPNEEQYSFDTNGACASLVLWPNPVGEKMSFEIRRNLKCKTTEFGVVLYDLNGIILRSQKLSAGSFTWDISRIASGQMLFMALRSDEKNISMSKVIVLH